MLLSYLTRPSSTISIILFVRARSPSLKSVQAYCDGEKAVLAIGVEDQAFSDLFRLGIGSAIHWILWKGPCLIGKDDVVVGLLCYR